MNAQQIFALQFVLSLLVYSLVAVWYVSPSLARLPLPRALTPLLLLHATRYIGLVFLVPTVVGTALPDSFAVPAAYGNLLAAILALLSLAALRGGWTFAYALVWIFNVVGVLDLLNALARGVQLGVTLGAAYYIPTVAVPALLVTHAMIFVLLLRRAPSVHAAS